jgi:ectoine hydroxylase-related dioxygenase (phytanoyl-CoA dioxygenase family)/predicted MFS family arabinose efflux permease
MGAIADIEKRRNIIKLAAAILVGTVATLVNNTLPAFLEIVARTRSLTDSQAGLITAADQAGFAIGVIACAQILSKLKRPNWQLTVAIGIGLLIVANLVSISVISFEPFFLIRMAAGIGAGIAITVVYGVLAEGDGARSMGYFNFFGIGFAWLAIPMMGPITERFGLGGLFAVIAGLAALAFFVIPALPRMSIRGAEAQAHHMMAREYVTPLGWLMLASMFIFFCGTGAVYAYMEPLMLSRGATNSAADSTVANLVMCSLIASALAAALGSKYGYVKPLIIGFIGVLGSVLLLMGFHSLSAFGVAAIVFGFAMTFIIPYQFEAMVTIDGTSTGAAWVNASTLFGLAAGPAIAGPLITEDYSNVIVLGLALGVLSLAMTILAIRLFKRQETRFGIERVPFGVEPEKLLEIVRRNGCVVIEGVLNAEQVAAVNRELDEAFEKEKFAGDWVPENDPFRGFLGKKTKRVMHCVAKSPTYCNEVLGSPMIYAYAKAVLRDAGPDVSIMATQGMGLLPGQPAQDLHRDQQYQFLEKLGADQPCVLCNMMLALVDFTDEIGATRVIPGSHQWKAWYREPKKEMAIPAVMKAGDIFFFDGKTIHGGGANRTSDTMRRSISTGFVSSLMSFGGVEEAHTFAMSLDQVRQMPAQVQKMLGFRSYFLGDVTAYGSWTVDHKKVEDVLGL